MRVPRGAQITLDVFDLLRGRGLSLAQKMNGYCFIFIFYTPPFQHRYNDSVLHTLHTILYRFIIHRRAFFREKKKSFTSWPPPLQCTYVSVGIVICSSGFFRTLSFGRLMSAWKHENYNDNNITGGWNVVGRLNEERGRDGYTYLTNRLYQEKYSTVFKTHCRSTTPATVPLRAVFFFHLVTEKLLYNIIINSLRGKLVFYRIARKPADYHYRYWTNQLIII